MSDSSCGDKTSDSVRRCHQMTLTLMPNSRKVKGIGSDSSRCSSLALADQTSDSNVTLDPKHQTSSDAGLSHVKIKRKRNRSGRKHRSTQKVTSQEKP